MSGQQSLIAVGGVGLIGVNFWTGAQRQNLDKLIWDKQVTPDARTSLLQIGGESILVLLLYMVAGQSDDIGNAMVVVLLTLWVLYFITQTKPKKG